MNSIEISDMYEDVPGLHSTLWDFIGHEFEPGLIRNPATCSSYLEGFEQEIPQEPEGEEEEEMPALETFSDSTKNEDPPVWELDPPGWGSDDSSSSGPPGDLPIPVVDDETRIGATEIEELVMPRTRAEGNPGIPTAVLYHCRGHSCYFPPPYIQRHSKVHSAGK